MSGFLELEATQQLAPPADRFSVVGTSSFVGGTGEECADLRGRGLVALPALGRQSGLTAVDLSNNSIAGLESAPEELPDDLQMLSLAGNKLSDLCHLKYLTACTSLIDLDISGNPVTDGAARIGFDLRPFLLFLLPRLQRLNGQDVRQARLLEASRTLFTDARGRLSDRLLEMLDDGRQVELTHYLSQQCPLVKRPRHVDSVPSSPRAAHRPETSQPLKNPETFPSSPIDEVPVGSGARRGLSYNGVASRHVRGRRTPERALGDTRAPESAPVSPRMRVSENAIMGFEGSGGRSPTEKKPTSPRSPFNRAPNRKARATKSRPQETGANHREGTSRVRADVGETKTPENHFSLTREAETTARAESVNTPRSPQKALAKRSFKDMDPSRKALEAIGESPERPVDDGHVALPQSPDAEVETEMVKRLVTAELVASPSHSQLETLAGDVKGQSRDLSDVRRELSGVRKELRHSRTQGNQELADVWAELTEVRTDLRNSGAELGLARADVNRARTELADVRAELGTCRKESRTACAELGASRAELGTVRRELDAVRTELSGARAELQGLHSRVRAESDARALLEEALRRMWAECVQLRAWQEAQMAQERARAAAKVQRVWRVWRARREREARVKERQWLEEALRPHVVKVQALIRGFLQRRRTYELRVRTAAAVRIQAMVRGYIQRKRIKGAMCQLQKDQWARHEVEALRGQLYHMQLWMHQMATSIASAPGTRIPCLGQSGPDKRGT
ncbi:hypothetical protein KFL_000900260 [Klebsormidium nitens]|uniref:Uncharacterized protein n=1 Tax=Klebsormidium nitens TaxID=105231 RepID=A0A0U9I6Y9_KLENI|nr:hypothetical protein KFL_000900260 [Klebsormidium nitens]|eukprot:GAQ81770.1 hypothetical protein KFL_000900260 [Klebsormidium nitens]